MLSAELKDHLRCFVRNERWGTCASCPRDTELHVYPEFCDYGNRMDHHLDIDALVRFIKMSQEKKI